MGTYLLIEKTGCGRDVFLDNSNRCLRAAVFQDIRSNHVCPVEKQGTQLVPLTFLTSRTIDAVIQRLDERVDIFPRCVVHHVPLQPFGILLERTFRMFNVNHTRPPPQLAAFYPEHSEAFTVSNSVVAFVRSTRHVYDF